MIKHGIPCCWLVLRWARTRETSRQSDKIEIGKVREQKRSGEILLLTFLFVTNFLSFII